MLRLLVLLLQQLQLPSLLWLLPPCPLQQPGRADLQAPWGRPAPARTPAPAPALAPPAADTMPAAPPPPGPPPSPAASWTPGMHAAPACTSRATSRGLGPAAWRSECACAPASTTSTSICTRGIGGQRGCKASVLQALKEHNPNADGGKRVTGPHCCQVHPPSGSDGFHPAEGCACCTSSSSRSSGSPTSKSVSRRGVVMGGVGKASLCTGRKLFFPPTMRERDCNGLWGRTATRCVRTSGDKRAG